MKKAICDAGCGQEFIVLEFAAEHIQGDVERVGFDCPHCGHKYTAYYTNDKTKGLQEQVKALLAKSDPRKHSELQLKGILSRTNQTKRKIKTEMDLLKKEVETG